jgi:hypothetical protein
VLMWLMPRIVLGAVSASLYFTWMLSDSKMSPDLLRGTAERYG